MSVQSVLFVHLAFLYGRCAPRPGGVYAGLVAPAATRRRSALHPGEFMRSW